MAVVLAALLACKGSDQGAADRTQPAASAKGKREASALLIELGSILVQPAVFAKSQDDTSDKTVTFNLQIEGVALAYLAVFRANSKAWRFGLEGMRCDRISELGSEVIQIVRGDGRPMSASWYSLKGGPLDGALAKVFPGEGEGLCNVMPGSPAYWAERGESPVN